MSHQIDSTRRSVNVVSQELQVGNEGGEEEEAPPTNVPEVLKERPKFWTKKRYFISLCQTSIYCYLYFNQSVHTTIIGPLLPIFTRKFGLTLQYEYLILFSVSAQILGDVFFSPISGFIIENSRRHFHFFTAFAVMCDSVLLLSVPFVENYIVFIILHFFIGISHAFLSCGIHVGLGWTWKEKVYPFFQLTHAIGSLGCFLSPLGVTQLFSLFDDSNYTFILTLIYPFLAFMNIVVIFPLLIIPVASPFKDVDINDISHRIGKKKTNKANQKISEFLTQCKKQFCSFQMIIFVSSGLVKGLSNEFGGFFGNIVCFYSIQRGIGKEYMSGWITSAFWGVMMISRVASIFIVLCVKDITILIVTTVMCIVLFTIFAFFPSNHVVIVLVIIFFGIFVGPQVGSTYTLSQSMFEKRVTPLSITVIESMSLFGVLVSFALDFLWELGDVLAFFGLAVYITILLVLIFLCCIKYFCVTRRGEELFFYHKSAVCMSDLETEMEFQKRRIREINSRSSLIMMMGEGDEGEENFDDEEKEEQKEGIVSFVDGGKEDHIILEIE